MTEINKDIALALRTSTDERAKLMDENQKMQDENGRLASERAAFQKNQEEMIDDN